MRRLPSLLAAFAALAALAAAAAPAGGAPSMPSRTFEAARTAPASLRVAQPSATYRWEAPEAKTSADTGTGPLRVGSVRAAPKSFAALAWQAHPQGRIARFDVASPDALGLRVRLDIADSAGPLELRVRGDDGRVESFSIAPGTAEAWGPWTPGERQAVEILARDAAAAAAVRLGAIVHFDQPLDAKAVAGACTVDTLCSTGDAALDAAIAEAKKAVARISFVDGDGSFLCTGTLLNSGKFPAPYFLTANHCIGRAQVAASITSLWFFEASACGSGQAGSAVEQLAGGMQVVFADPNTDQTLLLMNRDPPAGAVYAGWNAAKLQEGDAVTSLSHPAGDVSKWALGAVTGLSRFVDWEQSAWLVRYSRGITQGGSSGSGLFTRAGSNLTLRAVLSGSTVGPNGGLSCENTGERGIYNRFDVFLPQVARYLMADPPAVTDDHGNRPAEATRVALGAGETVVAGRIDYLGDVDVFRVDLVTEGTLVARATGGEDTVGVLLDARGERITSNDDAQAGAVDFGITRHLAAGTYYVVATHWESAATADYGMRFSFLPVTSNYTDLWWNPVEPGWGINVNHQGEKVFATLFTYDASGAPLWLVLPDGAKQPDGAFQGTLYRTSGPPFNASPWSPATVSAVGTMRLDFPTDESGRLAYTFEGVAVNKVIERQRFVQERTACSWSAFDRSYATNYQDLWWNPAEPGWGINVAHQGDTLFATLFSYGADGRSTWLVMSDGKRQAGTRRYSGTLFRTTGPVFNASPWTPASAQPVGTMSLAFADGNQGQLDYTVNGVAVAKRIERQVFAFPATQCEADDDP